MDDRVGSVEKGKGRFDVGGGDSFVDITEIER
jgi:hypothetical protein